jgi:S-adenosylmethionine synthetase
MRTTSDFIFVSESVTEGHPDKLCDQISDAIVDCFLDQQPHARVNAECAVSTGILFIAAHFTEGISADVSDVAREVIASIGYRESELSANSCSILTSLSETSAPAIEAASLANLGDEELEAMPSRHQATVFGYACDHTPSYMPVPVTIAHELARSLDDARRESALPWLSPDNKVQVAVEFIDHRPVRVHSVILTLTGDASTAPAERSLEGVLKEAALDRVFEQAELSPDKKTRLLVNPGGPLIPGGPRAHAGLTGRKTAIDTYGEYARHGGAALSGKDPWRVDRLGAYAARHAAKNIVAAGLARRCEVALSYAIGRAAPLSLTVETFGTGTLSDVEMGARLRKATDFRPAAVARRFELEAAIAGGGFFRPLAVYGHFGRPNLDLPWERTDLAEALAA